MLPPFPAEVLVKRCQTGKKGKGLKDLKGWLPLSRRAKGVQVMAGTWNEGGIGSGQHNPAPVPSKRRQLHSEKEVSPPPQLINVDGVGGRGSQDEKRQRQQRWEDYRRVQVP